MVSLVKNSTKKGAKIQNEYIFLLTLIWLQPEYRISTLDTLGVFFCDSLDLCYDPCHVIKHES